MKDRRGEQRGIDQQKLLSGCYDVMAHCTEVAVYSKHRLTNDHELPSLGFSPVL